MDALKAKRKGFRIAFTTCVNKIDELLLKEVPDLKELSILKNQLYDKFERLTSCQEEISNGILQIEISDKLFSDDFEAAEEYRDKFHAACAVLDSKLFISSLPKEVEKRKFKLPEIELKKFTGDPKEFLAFWSQFEKIHLDKSLPDEDKFQYLLQSVVPKSKAARVVESFPATAANYSKAVSQLRERFGREDLLVQIYVRELLTMVMRNAISGRAKVQLPILYDELEAKLRALDSLGRTQEKYGDFLTPLVESCLPEDILVAWERSRNKGTDSALPDDRTLENLMGFLKQEVMGEEMILLARTGFGANHHKKSKEGFNERAYEISSAAALVSTNTPENPGHWKADFPGSFQMGSKGFKVGDLVWAKLRFYPPWPAKIVELKSNAKAAKKGKLSYHVYFFGSKNFAWISADKIQPHHKSILNTLIKKKSSAYQHAIDALINYSKNEEEEAGSLNLEKKRAYEKTDNSNNEFPKAGTSLAPNIFENEMASEDFKVGDLVSAKMRFNPPWPAEIVELKSDAKTAKKSKLSY